MVVLLYGYGDMIRVGHGTMGDEEVDYDDDDYNDSQL